MVINLFRLILLAACCAMMMPISTSLAQGSTKVHSLLILDSQKGSPYEDARAALMLALQGHGYVEGKNLRTALRITGNDVQAGERILHDELKTNRYDVIFAGGTAATVAAKNVLLGDPTQHVVFASTTDPVGIGVIKDFSSKPFANFTGVCYPVPPKVRLKFIKQLLPKARKLGMIYADMPQSRSYNLWLKDLLANDPEFKDLKIIFRPVPLVTGENGDRLMAEAAIPLIREIDPQVDAFISPNDQMGSRQQFAEVVYKTATKPLIGLTQDDVMDHLGATSVIYPLHASIGEQAARMVKELFEGKSISTITPEWPKKYGFAVDLPKARKFQITVPVEILQLAGDNIVK